MHIEGCCSALLIALFIPLYQVVLPDKEQGILGQLSSVSTFVLNAMRWRRTKDIYMIFLKKYIIATCSKNKSRINQTSATYELQVSIRRFIKCYEPRPKKSIQNA
jgi:hypothetical protein